MIFKVGDLVRGAPFWRWGDQDYDREKQCRVKGVVKEVRDDSSWLNLPYLVEWENGHKNAYDSVSLVPYTHPVYKPLSDYG